MRLSDYGLSRERGFLASLIRKGGIALPLKPAREMALSIPQLICTGRVRALLERLPVIDLTDFCATASEAEQRIAMLHYSFMVQTYVWGEPEAPKALPRAWPFRSGNSARASVSRPCSPTLPTHWRTGP